MYGLKDAPRQFNKYMKKKLELMGWIEIYESVFIYIKNNEVEGIITSHVDDLLLFSSKENEKEILNNINNNFEIEEWIRINDGELHRYAGISLRYGKSECIVDQCHYNNGIDIGEIDDVNINKIKLNERELMVIDDSDSNIDKKLVPEAQRLIGIIGWLTKTQPHLEYIFSQVSRSTLKPTPKFINTLKKIIIYMKNHSRGIILKGINNPYIITYADSSYKRVSYESRSGYMYFLGDEDKKEEDEPATPIDHSGE